MCPDTVRLLLLADTHLGFDRPRRPRVKRRRRGEDFFASFTRALEPALEGRVDAVVHGGDLLYRSRVPADLVLEAMTPLFQVADRGVPVLLVPGNHERSRIPYPLLARHRGVHVFDRPRTVQLELAGARVAFGGFPYHGEMAGGGFERIVDETGLLRTAAGGVRVLCMHQLVEGARVGVQDYTFREGLDVIPARALPRAVAAVLSGHIHRGQLLARDLRGRVLPAPVIYSGSTERTSFDEREERKGYVELDIVPDAPEGGRLADVRFEELPTRPMAQVEIEAHDGDEGDLFRSLLQRLGDLPGDAVVRVRLKGPRAAEILATPAWRRIRGRLPSGMTVTISPGTRPPALHPQRTGRMTGKRGFY